MLKPGLYEQVINHALSDELDHIPQSRKAIAPIDQAESSKILSQYLANVFQKALDRVKGKKDDLTSQIELTNQIVNLIQKETQEADFVDFEVDLRAEQLFALLKENDPRLVVNQTANSLERPETSIAQSSLFTGAKYEPQMFMELKKRNCISKSD